MSSEHPSTASATRPPNLNLWRRPLPGFIALVLLAPLRPLLAWARRPAPQDASVAVFASYMVGDLYMALPALKKLAAGKPTILLCRPDCVNLLAREGLDAVPFDNAFLTRRTPAGFLRTWRAARALSHLSGLPHARHPRAPGAIASIGFDLDASPLSALWLRLAGIPRVASYRRDFGVLFDETFTLPEGAVHQADRDMAVVEYALNRGGRREVGEGGKTNPGRDPGEAKTPDPSRRSATDYRLPTTDSIKSPSLSPHTPPWLLSVWTRKPSKNWPLEKWDVFLEGLIGQGVACAVLRAPDGDDDYRRFCARWEGRVGFVAGSLDEIADTVGHAAGVIATDNFLGHMAGYHGKPVVWINMISPAAQVLPRGPRTIEVAPVKNGAGAKDVTVEAVRNAFEAARGSSTGRAAGPGA